jgi:hypothetical protein
LTDLIVDKHPVQRSLGGRGAIVFAKACELGLGESCRSAWARLFERAMPELAEGQEPRLCAGMSAAP